MSVEKGCRGTAAPGRTSEAPRTAEGKRSPTHGRSAKAASCSWQELHSAAARLIVRIGARTNRLLGTGGPTRRATPA